MQFVVVTRCALAAVATATVVVALRLPGNELAAEPHRETTLRRCEIPPLLEFCDGSRVRDSQDLKRRQAEIRRLLCEYLLGEFPQQTPAIVAAEVLDEQRPSDGSIRRRVRLTFDTRNKASFEIWVWLPGNRGSYPLLLTSPRFYQIYWAEDALARGYAVCLYPGLDIQHQEEKYPDYQNVWRTFQAEYPEAGWQSSLGIQAWLASRALDYLLDPKVGYDVERDHVGIIGFSRYGKQALYAAAFDPRFTAVVARSSGVPTAASYRHAGRYTFSEAISDAPEPWAKVSLRQFEGREDELPVDGPALFALIAPRHCQLHTAHHDGADPTFAVEQSYLQGREVYRLLGKPERFRILYRTGGHSSGPPPEQITQPDRKQNLDWLDYAFGRGTAKAEDFPEVLLHHFDWDAWHQRQPSPEIHSPFANSAATDNADRRQRIRWMLGETPALIDGVGEYHIKTGSELAIPDDERDRWACANTARIPVSFSGRIHGDIYYNPGVKQPAPAVIWLHPYSYGTGSNECYGVEDTTVYHRLAQQGCVVLSYDQCGFGGRLLEGCSFYQHYPNWSRLGRMVYDVSRAVDFLADGKGISQRELPPIDPQRIYVLGYSLGGLVGLHAAALDDRLAGVASFCGFTPLRANRDDRPTGGNQWLYRLHAVEPKLGLFAGHEQSIPYDYEDILQLIAPRPCLIYAPKQDRLALPDAVVATVEKARPAWSTQDAPASLSLLTPDDVNRFQKQQQLQFIEWLTKVTETPSRP